MHRNFLRFRPNKKKNSQNRSLIAIKKTLQKNFKTPTCSPFGPSKPPPIIANNIKLNLTWNAPQHHWINDRSSLDDLRQMRRILKDNLHERQPKITGLTIGVRWIFLDPTIGQSVTFAIESYCEHILGCPVARYSTVLCLCLCLMLLLVLLLLLLLFLWLPTDEGWVCTGEG